MVFGGGDLQDLVPLHRLIIVVKGDDVKKGTRSLVMSGYALSIRLSTHLKE